MRISDWSSDVCSSDLVVTLPGLFHKGEIDDFLVIQAGHPAAQGMRATQCFRTDSNFCTCLGRHIGDALETINSRHLFDKVFLDEQVETVGRRLHDKDIVLDGERQAQTRSEEHTSELQSLVRIS